MAELRFITMAGGLLRPDDEETAEQVQKWGINKFIIGEFRKPRNPMFHRKFMALMRLLYDNWNPPQTEYNGVVAQKSFKNFRKEITILAGYYDVVCSVKGETRVEAESISFGNMDNDTFEKLYQAVITVGIKKVLGKRHWDKDKVDSTVDQILSFT